MPSSTVALLRRWSSGVLPLVILVNLWLPARGQPHPVATGEADITATDPQSAAAMEAALVDQTRQLTFEGRRAGEGYFSSDGRQMVLQSEREGGNPFFQIYLLDLQTGDSRRVSPGVGKTTCAWIHPDGQSVLFSSTHADPQARQKQQEELQRRQEGPQRRYAWDYDEHYDIYTWQIGSDRYRNLTNTTGYDAEGSWSPDGQSIAFASNRRAYSGEMTDEERVAFERDPASMIDIYIMNGDGSDVRRLTESPGYDGGPFFSPDGQRITWRRFTPDGGIAEIWTMNVDGSDPRQLTRLGALSWAPFYHPSGEYLIFTTNRHGVGHFELYLIDVRGKSTPVRVTYTKGFDGLPVFSPCGRHLSWTSSRTASGQSQLFLANWNHQQARRLLGLEDPAEHGSADVAGSARTERESARPTTAAFSPADIMRHVDYLCRPELEGRLTGTRGERLATAYVAACLDHLGLQPAGDDGGWFQPFDFTSGVALGAENRLQDSDRIHTLQQDWVPVSFSQTGAVESGSVVFAGYGITAPADDHQAGYDSFAQLDVTDKWILAFRFLPEQVAAPRRQHLARHASLRYKAMSARDRGARGLILVSGPNSHVKQQLIPLQFDGSVAGSGIPVISITDDVAQRWLAGSRNLKELQDQLDGGELMDGFVLEGVELSATIEIEQVQRRGRNVLARLPASQQPSEQVVVVGAHVDHLGRGPTSSSLAREDESDQIHFGADDNASGVAAMLEIAAHLARLQARGELPLKRDVLFAAWSGEELGLIGSRHFVDHYRPIPAGDAADGNDDPDAGRGPGESLYPAITACLNLDMVGRLDDRLILQGTGSSNAWNALIERSNVPVGLPITLQPDSYLPTDATSFFLRGVPILSAFTGAHSEYHTPRDTPETLNYDGAARVAQLMARIAQVLATAEEAPDFVDQQRPAGGRPRATLRTSLGTIPDYAQTDVQGLRLSGVGTGGPAEKAGLRAGDVIVELAGKKIESIYDYMYALEALTVGQKVPITVQRGQQRLTVDIVPGSRQ